MDIIDLSGIWKCTGAEGGELSFDKSADFVIPGSGCDNRIGKRTEPFREMTRETVRSLVPEYDFVGELTLEREIEIPEDWSGKYIYLYMERVNIASEVFIDGERRGRRTVSLCAPHIYELCGIAAGRHTLTVKVDNRNILNIDHIASGYSEDTQSLWCGIIGRVELVCRSMVHISRVSVFPKEDGIDVSIAVNADYKVPHGYMAAGIELSVPGFPAVRVNRRFYQRRETVHIHYPMDEYIKWSEYNPKLYTLTARLYCDGCGDVSECEDMPEPVTETDSTSVGFGMRFIAHDKNVLKLNGRRIFLRGEVDCAIFPNTGYPPTDEDSWTELFKKYKLWGLNYIRCHSWVPPEAAFDAADKAGIYISCELPLWMNLDVCSLDTGSDMMHGIYIREESVKIFKEYGNHPSFIMFANGNELLGDFEMLEDNIQMIRALDGGRRLYSLTSNFDRNITPCDDYINAFQIRDARVRLQAFRKRLWEGTALNYNAATEGAPVPAVSFEIGQYCVYPDVESIDKFSGNLKPYNFGVIYDDLKKKGMAHRARDYVKASGDLAARLYKEEIEAALRTKDFGGIQLLGLHDYTGQCTATIGLLDVFYDSKGIITPERWRSFCSDITVLMESKRIYTSDEGFCAKMYLADFSEHGADPEYTLTLQTGGKTVFEKSGTLPDRAEFDLSRIQAPAMLKARIKTRDTENEWTVFVFKKECRSGDVRIIKGIGGEVEDVLKNGGRAVVLPDESCAYKAFFFPVFWSPAYFPSKKSCGMIINDKHEIFDNFPTEKYQDFQWYHPMEGGYNFDMSRLPAGTEPIIESVPNFFDNTPLSPLAELKTDKADIVFCGFDIYGETPEEQAIAAAVKNYLLR